MKDIIDSYIKESLDTIKSCSSLSDKIGAAAILLADTVKRGGKVLIFGNGGSAADSQHIAAEFICRFRIDRNPLPAIALSTNSSILTSVSNDYDFSVVFSRQVEALGNEGDAAIAISTSGNSENVIKGVEAASKKNIKVIALTGKDGGALGKRVDILLNVSSDITSFIQEGHLVIYHILCHMVEKQLF